MSGKLIDNMPVFSEKYAGMPTFANKQPGTQKASPAAAPKVSGDISGEAPSQPVAENVQDGEKRGFFDRAGDTLRGTVSRQESGYAGALEKLTAGLGRVGSWIQDRKDEQQAEQDRQYLAKYQQDLADALAAGDEKAAKTAQLRINSAKYRLKTNGDMGDYYDQVNDEAVQKLDAIADKKGAESVEAFQRAKDGAGVLGGLAVDAGSALADVLGDAGANSLAPGLGTILRVVRGFGNASEAAEEKGFGLGTQVLYGAGMAGIGEGVNRLFGGNPILEKATGKGALDDLIMPTLGKTLPGRMVKSGLGEGIEEGTEDILDALYQRAILGEKADPFSWKETGYDALVGGIVGGLTGISKPTLTDENGNWYDADGKKHSAVETDAQKQAGYVGEEPKNVQNPMIKSPSLTAKAYLNQGEDIENAYGNRYRKAVEASTEQRLGIGPGKPAYLVASNVTKNGETYYAKITRESLGKMLYTEKNQRLPVERLVLVDNIEKAIDSSVWVGSEGDRKNRTQINGFDTLRTSFYIDGEPYYADIIVKVVQQGKDANSENVVYFLEPESIAKIKKVDAHTPTLERHAPKILFRDAASTEDSIPQGGMEVKNIRSTSNDAGNEMDLVPAETTGTGTHQPQIQAAQGPTSEGSSPFKTGGRESGVPGGGVPSENSVTLGGMDVKNNRSTEVAMPRAVRSDAEIDGDLQRIRQEPPAGKEPTVEDLRRQAAGVGPNTVPQKPRQTQNESAMPKTLRDLGIDPYGSEADYTGAENLAMQTSSLKTMRRRMQSEIQKIAATAKERSFARQVAAGQLDMEDVPGTVDRNTVEILSDYYRALNGRSETQPLQNRRNKILEAEMAKMEPLLGMDVAYDERGLERRMIPGEGRLSKATNAARDSFAKTFSTFRRNLQTPARICEFEWGREHGAKVYKTLFQPVVENNGRQVAWMNNMLDGVREFADGSGNKRKLTKKERAVVQQLVENGAAENRVIQLKTNADNAREKAEKAKKAVERARSVGINNAEAIQRAAVLADEAKIAENLWSAAENIQKGWTAEDAAREFGIDKSDQSFKDLENYSIYLKAKQELDNSADVDSRIVDTAVKAYSENYRKLYDAINTFLVGHGYDTIGFIQGYAPHLQPETQKTAFQKAMKMLGLNETAMDLPTSISGQTADLKPYKQYDPFFQTRNGSKTDFDIVRGFESYIQYLGNIFYHTDDIMRIRTAEKYLRKTYTNKEASEMISWAENARNFSAGEKLDFLKEYAGVEEDSALSYQDASKLLEDYISKLYDQVGSISRYGELAKYLNNYANRLAGKQSELDRGVEYSLGRGALNWINQMESKYGGAKIAFNVSSALNQTSQIPMVAVEAGEKNTFTAMLDFMNPSERGKKERADFISRSNFLKGKAGVDWISEPETRSEKIREKGFAMSEAVDGFTSYVAVRGKYLQAVNEGKSPVEAMQIADEYGRRVMGSRAKGEKPMLFDTKNPFWQIATKFQLEVMNTWDHVFHDMPNDIKNTAQTEGKVSAARKLAGRVVKYEAYAFLLNAGFRALYGGTPIPFDLLGNALEGIADAMGLTMGEAVKTLLDDVLEAVLDERVFGTDDDDKDDEIDVGKGISSFLGNAANDMPLVGRAAALLGIGDQTLPMTDFSKLGDLGTSIRKNGLISADTGEAALNVASEFAYGGNQLRKTGQGLLALGRGGSYSGDKLRYPVERTPGNLVKGTLFGKSSFDSADEYYAHGSKTLTERMTRAYEGLVDNGVNREVAYDLLQKIRDQKDTPQKLEVITESLLTDREKLQLCYDVVAGKDDTWPDKLKKMMDAGLTWSEAEETYLEYLDLRDQEDMKAREKATRFAAWVDRSGVSDKQAAVIEDSLKFFTQIPAEADRYNAMTEAGLDSVKAERLTMRISQLRPEAGKETVSDLKRYEVVTADRSLSEAEQLVALESMMEDTEFEKLETAYAAGLTPGQYVEFKRATYGLAADKVNGKTVSGSKKAKVMAAIDAMQISNIQKTALYYAAGYKESTLDDAPWISGRSTVRSREDAIKLLQGARYQQQDLTMPKLTDENGEVWNPLSKKSSDIAMPRLSK